MDDLYVVTFYSMGGPNHNKKVLVVGMKNHLAALTYAINRKADIIRMDEYSNYNRIECQILQPTQDKTVSNSTFELYKLI